MAPSIEGEELYQLTDDFDRMNYIVFEADVRGSGPNYNDPWKVYAIGRQGNRDMPYHFSG